MIIFKDVCTGDEMCSDAYKMGVEGPEDFLLTVQGKTITQVKGGGGISADLIGGNPSQEEEQECCDETQMESGIDVCLAQGLTDQSDFFSSRKVLQTYLKKWLKNTAEALKDDEKKCECFKKHCSANIKCFLEKWSPDVSVYSGANFDPEEAKSGLFIGVWNEDGMGLTLYGIREGLIEEKC